MAIVAIPKVWATSDTLTATDLNTLNSVIYNEFNGNIDNTNIKAGANIDAAKLLDASIASAKLLSSAITDAKLDYTSIKVLRVGPTFAGANGKRVAVGSKAFTLSSGSVSVTITFSSDSDDGNPSFAAPPRMTFAIEHATGVSFYSPKITSILASSCTVEIGTTGAGATSGTLHWHAVGNA